MQLRIITCISKNKLIILKKTYKHIFFDLDRTLWDFDFNSNIVLHLIFNQFNLKQKGIKYSESFINTYKRLNSSLWLKYRDGILTKQQLRAKRFNNTLSQFGIVDDALSQQISEFYIQHSPKQKKLMPNTRSILDFLKKKYQLHIITNGFKEVQIIKLKESGIINYFNKIIISEEIGFLKPNKEIFLFAINLCKTIPEECLMIGDDIKSDILGAKQVGIDQVFYNYKDIKKPKYHSDYIISDLKDLKKFL